MKLPSGHYFLVIFSQCVILGTLRNAFGDSTITENCRTTCPAAMSGCTIFHPAANENHAVEL
ncbi:MAG: hypothetical protein DME26_10930 [Verrucomicrobia bacterium]|nr:MAG: hypothetical protein DME26_10930 [Verrucomicrobiota bacterium]